MHSATAVTKQTGAIALSLAITAALSAQSFAQDESMTGSVTRDGYELKYAVEGSGDIRMIVIGSMDYYRRAFAPDLRDHMQVAFVDHVGFTETREGQSGEAFTLAQVVSDTEAVRQQIGWDEFVMLGHSGHGFMAIEYAKAYPEHVSHLVLSNLAPSYSPEFQQLADRDWSELISPERSAFWGSEISQLGAKIEKSPQDRFLLFMLAMGARSWFDHDYDAAWLWEGVPINLQAIDNLWGVEMRDIDITRDIEKLDMPVLLLGGLWDYLVPPMYTWNEVRAEFDDLTVRVFAESGHTPMLEQPELFNATLLNWIGEKK